jgi:hypothetical protein
VSEHTLHTGETVAERLARLHNRATRYEVAATFGGASYLLSYTGRVSRYGLTRAWIDATTPAQRERIVDALGITDASPASYSAASGWSFGDGALRIRRTGRTERDAVIEGELPRLPAEVA